MVPVSTGKWPAGWWDKASVAGFGARSRASPKCAQSTPNIWWCTCSAGCLVDARVSSGVGGRSGLLCTCCSSTGGHAEGKGSADPLGDVEVSSGICWCRGSAGVRLSSAGGCDGRMDAAGFTVEPLTSSGVDGHSGSLVTVCSSAV